MAIKMKPPKCVEDMLAFAHTRLYIRAGCMYTLCFRSVAKSDMSRILSVYFPLYSSMSLNSNCGAVRLATGMVLGHCTVLFCYAFQVGVRISLALSPLWDFSAFHCVSFLTTNVIVFLSFLDLFSVTMSCFSKKIEFVYWIHAKT